MSAEPYTLDRSSWRPGPWDLEPEDRMEWRASGFPCLMLRNTSGNWCGYVGVEPGHPDYDQEPDLDVHGGVTYGSRCAGVICHVARSGEPEEVYWIGFDTAHVGDMTPAYDRKWDGDTYRDQAYTQQETEHLAEQLAARLGPRLPQGPKK